SEPGGMAVGVGEARQHRRSAQRFDPIGADAVEVLVEADDPAVEDPDPARPRPLGGESVGVEVGEDRIDSHEATLACCLTSHAAFPMGWTGALVSFGRPRGRPGPGLEAIGAHAGATNVWWMRRNPARTRAGVSFSEGRGLCQGNWQSAASGRARRSWV